MIAKVRERKLTAYAGVCRNCGGPTMGSTKKNIPEWCSKPACASAQRKTDRAARIRDAVAAWNVRDG